VKRLVVYYDARCGLCCAVRGWIARQRQIVAVECRPKPSEMEELVVVADSGDMWSGDAAWVVVLWALADYREWSYRLASPLLLPAARMFFAQLSQYRGPLACTLRLPADESSAHEES
jgi:hypothetical protein